MDKFGVSKKNILILSYPISIAFKKPFTNLSRLLDGCYSGDVFSVIACSKQHYDEYSKSSNDVLIYDNTHYIKLFSYISLQFKICKKVVYYKYKKNIKFIIIFMEGDALLPILLSKILQINTVKILPSNICRLNKEKFVLQKIESGSQMIGLMLVNKIVLYSPSLLKEWDLEKFLSKTLYLREHIVDLDIYNKYINIESRKQRIGFVGRFSNEKGIKLLLNTILYYKNNINKYDIDIHFLVVGDGIEKSRMMEFIADNDLKDYVTVKGWVDNDKLVDIFNNMRLLIVPSSTEGLPNVILEAMACGTPCLANPVGAIPDIISDGYNGFLIKDTSGDLLLNQIVSILQMNLNEISENCVQYVQIHFEFKNLVKIWNEKLQDVFNEKK